VAGALHNPKQKVIFTGGFIQFSIINAHTPSYDSPSRDYLIIL